MNNNMNKNINKNINKNVIKPNNKVTTNKINKSKK